VRIGWSHSISSKQTHIEEEAHHPRRRFAISCHTPKRPPGLTLVELVVVIAIIGVLIALLLPAVQKVREATLRSSCRNNLRQIGIALHNYEGQHGFFPPCGYDMTPPPMGHSFYSFLLPFVEQDNVYKQIRFDLAATHPQNLPLPPASNRAGTTRIRTYMCPAAPDRLADYGKAGLLPIPPGIATLGVTDYAVITGIGTPFANFLPPGTPRGDTGTLLYDTETRVTDIRDGTSYTLLIAEDAGRIERYEMGKLVPGQWSDGGAWGDYNHEIWVHGSNLDGSGGRCVMNCTNDNEIYSFHSGGAHVLMADGSIHFLNPSIQPGVLAALISKAGGEPISGADF
jgi:prepilin-type N-terminal cleavage/methylation domain-containing protein/prepilin-type processing-associated H-X9-DG protein